MSLVLRVDGPSSSQAALRTVWEALSAVAAQLDVAVPPALGSETPLPADPAAALAVLALLRTASAALPDLVFAVSGSEEPGLPAFPVVLRNGRACRPRRGAAPSPDAHRDQQLVACVRAHWSQHAGVLGLDDPLPRVSAPPTGLVLEAGADAVEVHNGTGATLQDLVVELLGWSDGKAVDRVVTPRRALAPGATASWPLRGSGGLQWTAQAQALRVQGTRSGTSPVSVTRAGALVLVSLDAEREFACSVAVAVEDEQGALLGVQECVAPVSVRSVSVVVRLAEPQRAARARWTWTQHRSVATPPVPVSASAQPPVLDLRRRGPPAARSAGSAAPQHVPVRSGPAPAPLVTPSTPAPALPDAGSDRFARAEREPWSGVSSLFPLNSLDMDGRDRVRGMLQSQRVASIVAGCNISRSTGWKTTVQTMRRLVSHEDAAVRVAAAAGIGALAGPAMEHLLVRLVEQDPEEGVRAAATAALAALRSR